MSDTLSDADKVSAVLLDARCQNEWFYGWTTIKISLCRSATSASQSLETHPHPHRMQQPQRQLLPSLLHLHCPVLLLNRPPTLRSHRSISAAHRAHKLLRLGRSCKNQKASELRSHRQPLPVLHWSRYLLPRYRTRLRHRRQKRVLNPSRIAH
jgi:hypothetical protein